MISDFWGSSVGRGRSYDLTLPSTPIIQVGVCVHTRPGCDMEKEHSKDAGTVREQIDRGIAI